MSHHRNAPEDDFRQTLCHLFVGALPGFAVPAIAILVAACGTSENPVEDPSQAAPAAEQAPAVPHIVVARVGDRELTGAQLLEFSSRMPEELAGITAGVDRLRNHLQTMIDRETLWMEAERRELYRGQKFRFEMRKVTEKRLVGIYQTREIRVQIDQEEFQAFIEQQEYNRAIRFSEIIVKDRKTARTLRQRIVDGDSFEEIAKKWSINDNTAPKGGDRGRFTNRFEVDPVFQEDLFALDVDELSEPIPTASGLWAIIKITDETLTASDPETLRRAGGELQRRKFNKQRLALANKLARDYKLTLNEQGLSAFVARTSSGASFTPEEEDDIVIYTFEENGRITAGDLLEILRVEKEQPSTIRSKEQALELAGQRAIPDAMIFEAAKRAGIDKEPLVADWIEKQRRWYLMIELRNEALENRLDVSGEEARRYFEEHADVFSDPELLRLEEILVATWEEADSLKALLADGADITELAAVHSTRSLEQRDEFGRIEVYAFEKAAWGGLTEAALAATMGALTGPVEVTSGYSLFRVVDRGRKAVTFEKVKARVIATVKWLRRQVVFEEMIEELRPQYAAMVEIDEAALASLLEYE